MKRVFVCILAGLIIFCSVIPVNAGAAGTKTAFLSDQFNEDLWHNYQVHIEGYLWEYLTDDAYCPTSGFVEQWENDYWFRVCCNLTDNAPSKERYLTLLLNYICLLDCAPNEMVERQVDYDIKKTLGEYGLDALEIGVDFIGVNALGPEATSTMQKISTALNLTMSAADLTYNTIEKLKTADWAIKDYQKFELFLTAIINYSDDKDLRSAASDILRFSQQVLYSRLTTIASIEGDIADYLGKDVFYDTVFVEGMLKDADILGLDDTAFFIATGQKTLYQFLQGGLKGGKDLGVFLANISFGVSDMIVHVQEMVVLENVRKALIKCAQATKKTIKGAENQEQIKDVCALLTSVSYINFRSLYCLKELCANDAKFMGVIKWGKKSGREEAEEMLEGWKEITLNFTNTLSGIIPDIKNYYNSQGTSTADSKIYADSFSEVISLAEEFIGYGNFSTSQKSLCCGDVFEINGERALCLFYKVPMGAAVDKGYYIELWVEREGKVQCLAKHIIENSDSPDVTACNAYIRMKDEGYVLNTYVRVVGQEDVSHNCYYSIGEKLELTYELFSKVRITSTQDGLIIPDETSAYYAINQQESSCDAYYSKQHELNWTNKTVIELNPVPNYAEGIPPQGKSFEELLKHLNNS